MGGKNLDRNVHVKTKAVAFPLRVVEKTLK